MGDVYWSKRMIADIAATIVTICSNFMQLIRPFLGTGEPLKLESGFFDHLRSQDDGYVDASDQLFRPSCPGLGALWCWFLSMDGAGGDGCDDVVVGHVDDKVVGDV